MSASSVFSAAEMSRVEFERSVGVASGAFLRVFASLAIPGLPWRRARRSVDGPPSPFRPWGSVRKPARAPSSSARISPHAGRGSVPAPTSGRASRHRACRHGPGSTRAGRRAPSPRARAELAGGRAFAAVAPLKPIARSSVRPADQRARDRHARARGSRRRGCPGARAEAITSQSPIPRREQRREPGRVGQRGEVARRPRRRPAARRRSADGRSTRPRRSEVDARQAAEDQHPGPRADDRRERRGAPLRPRRRPAAKIVSTCLVW